MPDASSLLQIQNLAPYLLQIALDDDPIQFGLTKSLRTSILLLQILKDGNVYSTSQLALSASLSYNHTQSFLLHLHKGGVPFHPNHSGGKPGKGNSSTWQLYSHT